MWSFAAVRQMKSGVGCICMAWRIGISIMS
jgi:hypothetical protein